MIHRNVMSGLKKRLSEILEGNIVLVGLGNILRSDDGVGVYLIQRLAGKVNAVCLDAGIALETYLGKIVKAHPDTVLLVDAVHLGLAPGQSQVLTEDEILQNGLTTHDLSPKFFIQYLKEQTSAGIYLLGVQPKRVDMGEEMSPEVTKALAELEGLLLGLLASSS